MFRSHNFVFWWKISSRIQKREHCKRNNASSIDSYIANVRAHTHTTLTHTHTYNIYIDIYIYIYIYIFENAYKFTCIC